jgi:uncharacterized protein YxeA
MVLSIFKNRSVYFSEHNVSETEFCLRPQVEPTQLDPIDRASPYLQTFKYRKTVDNVQKHDTCSNVPSSQTFKSYQNMGVHQTFTFTNYTSSSAMRF